MSMTAALVFNHGKARGSTCIKMDKSEPETSEQAHLYLVTKALVFV